MFIESLKLEQNGWQKNSASFLTSLLLNFNSFSSFKYTLQVKFLVLSPPPPREICRRITGEFVYSAACAKRKSGVYRLTTPSRDEKSSSVRYATSWSVKWPSRCSQSECPSSCGGKFLLRKIRSSSVRFSRTIAKFKRVIDCSAIHTHFPDSDRVLTVKKNTHWFQIRKTQE